MAVLWFVYMPVAYLEHSTTVCGLMAGRTHLQLAHPPPPPLARSLPPTQLLISDTHDITGVVKLSQKPAVNTAWQS